MVDKIEEDRERLQHPYSIFHSGGRGVAWKISQICALWCDESWVSYQNGINRCWKSLVHEYCTMTFLQTLSPAPTIVRIRASAPQVPSEYGKCEVCCHNLDRVFGHALDGYGHNQNKWGVKDSWHLPFKFLLGQVSYI